MPIRILLVDDHAVVRQGLRMFLGLDPDFEIVGEAANGAKALELARQLRPDVVLMDQARLEPAALVAAWLAGRALPLEEAIVLGPRAVMATEPGGMADATRPAGAHALGAG